MRVGALLLIAAVAAPAAAQTLTPGLYETTASATRVEVPGDPALSKQVMAQTNAAMAKPMRQCWTRAMLTGDPAKLFASGPSGCKPSRQRFAGGVIVLSARCAGGGTVDLDGRYTPTGATVNMRVVSPAGDRAMRIETRSTSRRVGDCPPAAQEKRR